MMMSKEEKLKLLYLDNNTQDWSVQIVDDVDEFN